MLDCLKKIVSVRVLDEAFMRSQMRAKRNEPSKEQVRVGKMLCLAFFSFKKGEAEGASARIE